MSKDFMDVLFSRCGDLQSIAYDLRAFSKCFSVVGNEKMSGELSLLSEAIFENVKEIRDSYSDSLSRSLDKTKRETGEVVGLCLQKILRDANKATAESE